MDTNISTDYNQHDFKSFKTTMLWNTRSETTALYFLLAGKMEISNWAIGYRNHSHYWQETKTWSFRKYIPGILWFYNKWIQMYLPGLHSHRKNTATWQPAFDSRWHCFEHESFQLKHPYTIDMWHDQGE